MAAMQWAWLRRKVSQPCDGGLPLPSMYLATVDRQTLIPSLSSSPWIRRGAPKWVRPADLTDQPAYLHIHTWPSGFPARLLLPQQPKAGAVPAHHRFGLNDRDRLQHLRLDMIERCEQQAVPPREFRPFSELALEDRDLVTKGRDVGLVCRRPHKATKQTPEKGVQKREHRWRIVTRFASRARSHPADQVFGRDW